MGQLYGLHQFQGLQSLHTAHLIKGANIQLTNGILWNGKFYYQDVIKITITQAKGEGKGHFYNIEVIDFTISQDPIR